MKWLVLLSLIIYCHFVLSEGDTKAPPTGNLPAPDTTTNAPFHHKPLFSPFTRTDLIGSITVFITALFTSAAGIGGGGLLVPLFILILGFDVHSAVPMSKATIFGSTFASVVFNWKQHNPYKPVKVPLIDFDTANVLVPLAMGGSVVGVWLNRISPNWFLTVLLIFILSITGYETIKKAKKTWKKETEALQDEEAKAEMQPLLKVTKSISMAAIKLDHVEQVEEDEEGPPRVTRVASLRVASLHNIHHHAPPTKVVERIGTSESSNKKALISLLEAEGRVWGRVAIMVGVWLTITFLAYLKGGRDYPSPIFGPGFCGTLGWYLFNFGSVIVVLGFYTVIYCEHLFSLHKKRVQLNYPFTDGDVRWEPSKLKMYPALAVGSGLFSGLLGVGGGMLLNPVMVQMGLTPQTVNATGGYNVFFNDSSQLVQFVMYGLVTWDYAAWYCVIGMVGGFLSQWGLKVLIRRTGRPSIIIFVLGIVIILSTVVAGYQGILSTINDIKLGRSMWFDLKDVC